MNTIAPDDDEREEELDSLLAIFPELTLDSEQRFSASLDLPITPTKPFLIRFIPDRKTSAIDQPYAQALSDTAAHIEHDVRLSRLPPLHVRISLPVGYPETEAPQIGLSTTEDWLSRTKLRQLEMEAEKLWSEYGCCQILFTYIDFLQQSADEGFGLGDGADGCLTLSMTKEKALMDYDRAATLATFKQGTYDCEICLEPKKGSACYRMEQCQHVFCLQCLQDFYNNAIAEGDVATVRCLSPGCGKETRSEEPRSTLHPRELLAMGIDEAKVRRYLELKRKKRMESDKTTVYCPRTWCQGAARSPRYPPLPKDLNDYVELYEEKVKDDSHKTSAAEVDISSVVTDRLAVCEKCSLAFCRVCYMGWHGSFQRCYPRDPNELSVEEKASYEYIRLNTSPCPTCNSPTQKTMGCNHMRCFQCNTHFCYLCGAWLSGDNPYAHFNTAGNPCYQKLWELEEGDEGPRGEDGGNQPFGGGRGYEQMAIEVAREADAREAEVARIAAEQAQNRAQREAAELQAFALAEQDDVSDDELDEAVRELALNGQRARLPAIIVPVVNGHAAGRRRDGPAAQPNADRRENVRARPLGNGEDRQLRRFLDLAARDAEDEWDSDELGDEQDFVIR